MRSLLLFLSVIGALIANAQPLTLDTAIARAIRHDRIQQQILAIDSMAAVRDRDVANAWLPRLDLNATSTWQNEQISFPGGAPGVSSPLIPLDFHRVLVNFNQTVYDGNTTYERRELAALDADGQRLQAEARMIDLKGQVIQRFMGILLCAEQLRLSDLKSATMEEQRLRVHHAVEAGAALSSEEDVLRAELLTTEQERIGTEALEARLRGELVLLTGDEEARNATLVRPEAGTNATLDPAQRPDIRAFDVRVEALETQLGITTASRRPTLGVFGNLGGGLPGYNILDNSFRPMVLGGISLQWRILGWGEVDRKRATTALQRGILLDERERALRQVNMALIAQDEEIHKLDRLLDKDDELIALRGNVARAKSEQLALGTVTASDYITELNKENTARLGLEVHQLQRLLAQRVRLNIAGQ
ncbi:MAG: TolC family protein [Flavobacteriales bacterium]